MEERVGFVLRSSELTMGLLSSDIPVEMEVDIAASIPSSLKPSSSKTLKTKTRAFHDL